MAGKKRKSKRKQQPKTVRTRGFMLSAPQLLDEDTIPVGEVRAIYKLFPNPVMAPSQRDYGEQFYPQYVAALKRLRKLADA